LQARAFHINSIDSEADILSEGSMASTEGDIFIESMGDIFLNKISSARNLIIKTPGKVFLQDTADILGSLLIEASDIHLNKQVKSHKGTYLKATHTISFKGSVESMGPLEIFGKHFLNEGIIKAEQGALLQLKKFENKGPFQIQGQALRIETEETSNFWDIESQEGIGFQSQIFHNQGSIRSWHTFSFKGQQFFNHKNALVFTSGVHQVDVSQYQDSGLLYVPSLFILKGDAVELKESHKSYVYDGIINASTKFFVDFGAELFSWRSLLLASNVFLNHDGKIDLSSSLQFPFLDYFLKSSLEGIGKNSFKKHTCPLNLTTFGSKVKSLSIDPSWADVRRGLVSGVTLSARTLSLRSANGLSSGSLRCFADRFTTKEADLKAGYFNDDNVAIKALSAMLESTHFSAPAGAAFVLAHDIAAHKLSTSGITHIEAESKLTIDGIVQEGITTKPGELFLKAQIGDIVSPQSIYGTCINIAFKSYDAHQAIDTSNKLINVDRLFMDVRDEELINKQAQVIFGHQRQFLFKRVDNTAELRATGGLSLEGIEGFRTTKDIKADAGLSTVSREGKHETLEGAVLSAGSGHNYVYGEKGLVLESVLQGKVKSLKRAGYTGTSVGYGSGADFHNTAGQIMGETILSKIAGDQYEHAIEYKQGTKSLDVDGHEHFLIEEKGAKASFARAEFKGSRIYETIEGKLISDAGIRFAFSEGSLSARKGIQGRALHHTHMALDEHERSGFLWHSSQSHYMEGTDFYTPKILSNEGSYNVVSSEGEIEFEALLFDVAKTSRIHARGNVNLLASKARNHYRVHSSSLWGLNQSFYDGFAETAEVSKVLGREKVFIMSDTGDITLQSSMIEVEQGGGLIAPKGRIIPKQLELGYDKNELTLGLNFAWFGSSVLEGAHPVLQRIASLNSNEDGLTGIFSDVVGLGVQGFNSIARPAKSYSNGQSLGSILLQESGISKFSLGFEYKSSSERGVKALTDKNGNLVASIVSKSGDFVIQAVDDGADLRGYNTHFDSLVLDTNSLKLGGVEENSKQRSWGFNFGVSWDFLDPTAITLSAGGGYNNRGLVNQVMSYNHIRHLQVMRPDSVIGVQNANLDILKHSGETFSVHRRDLQDQHSSKGFNLGLSVTLDLAAHGAPKAIGASLGIDNLQSYQTHHRSEVSIPKGGTYLGLVDHINHNRTEGFAFNASVNLGLDARGSVDLFSQGVSMPFNFSGQIGDTRFRIEPAIINPEVLARDVEAVKRAPQLIKEDFSRKKTREAIHGKILREGLMSGLTEFSATNIADAILKEYDQQNLEHHPEKGIRRLLDHEKSVFISKQSELKGASIDGLRNDLEIYRNYLHGLQKEQDRGLSSRNAGYVMNANYFFVQNFPTDSAETLFKFALNDGDGSLPIKDIAFPKDKPRKEKKLLLYDLRRQSVDEGTLKDATEKRHQEIAKDLLLLDKATDDTDVIFPTSGHSLEQVEALEKIGSLTLDFFNKPRDFLIKGKQLYGERVVSQIKPLADRDRTFLNYISEFGNLLQVWGYELSDHTTDLIEMADSIEGRFDHFPTTYGGVITSAAKEFGKHYISKAKKTLSSKGISSEGLHHQLEQVRNGNDY
jgi:hypothetical protein